MAQHNTSIYSLLSTLSVVVYFLSKFEVCNGGGTTTTTSTSQQSGGGDKLPNLKLAKFEVPDASALVDDRTYDEWYQGGMTAYTEEKWADTIWYFENGVKEFRYYRSSLVYCRVKCSNITSVSLDDKQNNDLIEQRYFQVIFKKALCIRQCKYEKLGNRPERINPEITDKFLSQTPYSYLQFAYYKNLDYEKAVAAAYTYVQANPNDSVMYNNLEYYRNLHGITEEHLIDLEEKNHNKHFMEAYTAYEVGNWTGVIYHMETALSYYWLADEECRAMCEGKYENREFMDLYEAMANHYASTLFCKDQCETWLATVQGKVIEDYLPNHFHFLQFAYFHEGEINSAVAAASAFMQLRPDDEVMKSNMAYYESEAHINKYTLQPRPDILEYKERWVLEKEMLEYAKNEFWDDEDQEVILLDDEKFYEHLNELDLEIEMRKKAKEEGKKGEGDKGKVDEADEKKGDEKAKEEGANDDGKLTDNSDTKNKDDSIVDGENTTDKMKEETGGELVEEIIAEVEEEKKKLSTGFEGTEDNGYGDDKDVDETDEAKMKTKQQ